MTWLSMVIRGLEIQHTYKITLNLKYILKCIFSHFYIIKHQVRYVKAFRKCEFRSPNYKLDVDINGTHELETGDYGNLYDVNAA